MFVAFEDSEGFDSLLLSDLLLLFRYGFPPPVCYLVGLSMANGRYWEIPVTNGRAVSGARRYLSLSSSGWLPL